MSSIDQQLTELSPVLRDVVVVFIIDENNNKVLFGERKKLGQVGLGKRVGIGGGIDLDESPLKAVLREVREETGTKENGEVVFELESADQVGVVYFLFPHKKETPGYNQRCHVFIGRKYSGEPVETKEIKPEWYPVDELPQEFMWPDNLLWVPRVLQGETIEGVFVYGEDGTVIDYRIEP